MTASHRPASRVAAGLLVLTALLLALHNALRGTLGTGLAVFVAVLLLAAAGLVWGGQVGYWVSLPVVAFTTLAAVASVAERPTVAGVAVAGGVVVALVLLLSLLRSAVASARRSVRRQREPPHRYWPKGWTPAFAGGWGDFVLMLGLGGVCTASGAWLFTPDLSWPELAAGLGIAAFGLACLGVAPSMYPGPRLGRPRMRMLRVDDVVERGVGFPYSLLRTSGVALAAAPMAVASLWVAMLPGAAPGERLVGVVGFCFFGLGFGYLVVRRALFRRWWVVATPSTVGLLRGGVRTLVPWSAIDDVVAAEVRVRVSAAGVTNRTPLIGFIVNDSKAVRVRRLRRALMPLDRRASGADVNLPIQQLHVDPVLVYRVLRHYHQHPEERAELGTETGLEWIRRQRELLAAGAPRA